MLSYDGLKTARDSCCMCAIHKMYQVEKVISGLNRQYVNVVCGLQPMLTQIHLIMHQNNHPEIQLSGYLLKILQPTALQNA